MNIEVHGCSCCGDVQVTVMLRGHTYVWVANDGADLFQNMLDKVNDVRFDFYVEDALAIAFYTGLMIGKNDTGI